MARKNKTQRQEELQDLLAASLEEAIQHHEESILPDMVKATKYYYGEPFGGERKGRSQVVATVLRDATLGQLPSLIRILLGREKSVEFAPRNMEDVEVAAQQTEYVEFIIREDNQGFLLFQSMLKDALVRRLGILTWWWDDDVQTTTTQYSGLTEEQVLSFLIDPECEFIIEVVTDELDGTQTYEGTKTIVDRRGRARIEAVPPEELVFTPDARSKETAPLFAHIRDLPADDIIGMGVDPKFLEFTGEDLLRHSHFSDSDMALVRFNHLSSQSGLRSAGERSALGHDTSNRAESQELITFARVHMLVDSEEADDNGQFRTERRVFDCVGSQFEITNGDGFGEVVDELPYALFTPEPEPHTIIGLGNFDLTAQFQRIQSQIERALLNSLAQSVDNITEAVQGEVNMADLLDPDVSKIVRVRRPGMIREVRHSFIGQEALATLAHYKGNIEESLGTTRAAQGLDSDALQSTTAAAVKNTFTKAQERTEMMARVFAETGMRDLYKGVLRLVMKHQDQKRVIRLRNKYVEIDPNVLDADMDVRVLLGLGQGPPEERLVLLNRIVEGQTTMMQSGSPLVSNVELRNALGMMVELGGFSNPEMFFKPWGPQEEQQMQEALKNQPPPPDPTQDLVEIERLKVETTARLNAAKQVFEEQKFILENDFERDKLARESELKAREIEAEFKTQLNSAVIGAAVENDRQVMDADLAGEQQDHVAAQAALASSKQPAQPEQGAAQ